MDENTQRQLGRFVFVLYMTNLLYLWISFLGRDHNGFLILIVTLGTIGMLIDYYRAIKKAV